LPSERIGFRFGISIAFIQSMKREAAMLMRGMPNSGTQASLRAREKQQRTARKQEEEI